MVSLGQGAGNVRTLFKYIIQYIMAVVLLVLCLAAWIIYDGLHDLGAKADVALVIDQSASAKGPFGAVVHEGLDRAIQFYRDNYIALIIVAGSPFSAADDSDAMAKYLESKGIPANAIVKDHQGRDLQRMAHEAAEIMKVHDAQSVFIFADYYEITPVKLALVHENVVQIGKIHGGTLQKEDVEMIGREIVNLGEFVGTVYLIPAAEKAKQEAQAGLEKATMEAQQAKASVDKKLDSMSK